MRTLGHPKARTGKVSSTTLFACQPELTIGTLPKFCVESLSYLGELQDDSSSFRVTRSFQCGYLEARNQRAAQSVNSKAVRTTVELEVTLMAGMATGVN
jgi:hypothetical protein